MGTTGTLFIEKFEDKKWNYVKEYDLNKWYTLFRILANVRNHDYNFNYITSINGWGEKSCNKVNYWKDDEDFYASNMLLKQVLDFDFSQVLLGKTYRSWIGECFWEILEEAKAKSEVGDYIDIRLTIVFYN